MTHSIMLLLLLFQHPSCESSPLSLSPSLTHVASSRPRAVHRIYGCSNYRRRHANALIKFATNTIIDSENDLRAAVYVFVYRYAVPALRGVILAVEMGRLLLKIL